MDYAEFQRIKKAERHAHRNAVKALSKGCEPETLSCFGPAWSSLNNIAFSKQLFAPWLSTQRRWNFETDSAGSGNTAVTESRSLARPPDHEEGSRTQPPGLAGKL